MKGKKFLFIISCFSVLIFLITGCSSSNTEEASKENNEGQNNDGVQEVKDSYTFKVATPSTPEDPDSVFIYKAYMDKVTELTDGKIQFEWYPSQQLGASGDYIQLTRDGVADIAMYTTSVYANELSLGNRVTALPGIYDNSYEGSMAFHAVSQQSPMIDEFLKHGVRPLLAATSPTFNLYTKGTEIKVPSDLKGLRVRTSAGTLSELIQAAASIPVAIPAPDIYEAYDKGAVDVLHQNAASDTAYGIRELSNWGTRSLGFSAGTTGLMISEEFWKSLSEDLQQAMTEAADYVVENGSKAWDKDHIEREDRWIESGDVPLHDITESERAEWDKFFKEFEEEFVEKQGDEFKTVLEQFKMEVEKVRQ
ncbi:TRAP transporter substrate-binding protein DctP [Bacillus sp. B15-48]|uniref:TRAP transporter substrate-binding protein DctP n=1 Tax=Bacillus sp. B15-48 TaxID=1548601 RepID=UPI00193FBA9C|nr:TRAP transporter substrate-binding protein DctP [Bacillus sp. B15-48]MBM4763360.1 hypothetical protein [Bacillus sp. B15-48]